MGVAAALEARRRDPAARVVLIEKEDDVARHASGRNSGVLHAGLYYQPGGLKARLARDGCARLTRYCLERGLPINRCGKLIVPTHERDEPVLDELFRRARANGVEIHQVDRDAARGIDPAARVHGRAAWVPATASVDPAAIVRALADDARDAGVQVRTGEAFIDWREKERLVTTSRGRWSTGYVLNAAGAHADTVARRFGHGDGYRIIPFKGRYLAFRRGGADGRAYGTPAVRCHIYPVPDLRNPFLGVHLTVAVDGSVWVGPTATPVLGREHYGLAVRPGEAATGLVALGRLIAARPNAGLRRLAALEIRRRWPGQLLREARRLARDLPPAGAWRAGRPGIRAQLVDTRTWAMENDFVYQADDRSLHVLNAVSPAFTSALPLAEELAAVMEGTRRS